jgi:non-canonical purine NTP pyrophosphatase (RdgB/HAM1 family)
MLQVYFATTNRNKLEEAKRVLGFIPGVKIDWKSIDVPEIQSLDGRKVVEEKAKAAFAKVKKPVIVEDTSLSIMSWNGFPGPLIAWAVKTMGIDKICRLSGPKRTAKAEACVTYYDGKKLKTFCGSINGRIAIRPRGSRRFDWDRIFIPEGHGKTFAEMTLEEKNRISHRMKAFAGMRKYLEEISVQKSLF